MQQIEWTEDLSVGINIIDKQHQIWIEHYNNLAKAVEAMHGPEKISATLAFLADYTRTHFKTEEEFMSKYKYPDIHAHKEKHNSLKSTLATLLRDYEEEGLTHNLTDATNTFLGNWLINHIRETDKLLAAFLAENNIVIDD